MNFRVAGLVITAVLVIALFFLNREDVELMKQTDIEWEKISSSGYEVSSTIHLYNPNLLSSTIKSIDEKLLVNGKQVGELNNAITQGIPGRKETTFPVRIRFSKDELPPFYTSDSFSSRKIPITLKGEITFENLFGGGKILIDQNDSVYVAAF